MATHDTESGQGGSKDFGERRELVAAVRDAAREMGDTVACAIHDSSTKLADAVMSTGKMLLRELGVQSREPQGERAPSINAIYARKHGGRPMSDKTKEEVAFLERMRAQEAGERTMTSWNIHPDTPLDELWARWISETATERDPETNKLYLTTYGATHFTPFFGTVGAITTRQAACYSRQRLGHVKKTTVDKELAALRRFLGWCEEQGYVSSAPHIATTGRRATGTAYAVRRRGKATELTADEARAIIELLPEYSSSKRVPPFVVRLRFVFAFETALRPETLNCLKVPDHYIRGAAKLNITDDIDKARFGRVVPLTEEARAALDAICPDSGLIFGDHDYRDQLRKAAEAVLDPQRAKTFTAYDLRHHRLTQLAEEVHCLRPTAPSADSARRRGQPAWHRVPGGSQARHDDRSVSASVPTSRAASAQRGQTDRLPSATAEPH
ncbi:MAG TPA: hypothetical protein VJV79_19750 [Polyangiaceae bacterium]|nr:hypothetical protein [Polyangiaceae bacterium]